MPTPSAVTDRRYRKPAALLAALLALTCGAFAAEAPATVPPVLLPAALRDFSDRYCSGCHNDSDLKGRFDFEALSFDLTGEATFAQWTKIHDRIVAGEMPPKEKARPDADEQAHFLAVLRENLTRQDRAVVAREGRTLQRRLNGYEYENALRDLLSLPWLQVKEQFPEDGERHRFNKSGAALDVSHVHLARYMAAADGALRQALTVKLVQPPTATRRYYARDQRSLSSKLLVPKVLPDRNTFPVIGVATPQPEVRRGLAPLTDPARRDEEAVAWVSSNYSGFTYLWDEFHAPVSGRYRVRFSAHTVWVPPGGVRLPVPGRSDYAKRSAPDPNLGDYDRAQPGRTQEPVSVYTRRGLSHRRVGAFDLTPEPAVHDLGEIWLLADETLLPDPSRFFRSRPDAKFINPLMTSEGAPAVAFRWMEVEGPFYDDSTTAGYHLLFGDLPLVQVARGAPGVTLSTVDQESIRRSRREDEKAQPLTEVGVDVLTTDPERDAERLLRAFIARAYRRAPAESEIAAFLDLMRNRRAAGLSFAESMLAGYTAVLASPGFVFLDEKPGRLEGEALATRLALFLWNSPPDAALLARARRGELSDPAVLRAETERLLDDPRSARFVDAFLDYWLDLRKMSDSTPSTTLYNDYYLDDALVEAARLESQLFFTDLVRRDLPARNLAAADFTFVNGRLAEHYGLPGVTGVAMRRVDLPADSPRGGFLTQASVLKVTANGTTTSPVLRGKWIVERILGIDIPPPPPVAAVEPDIRGAVTIRQQLAKHRSDASCASCHRTMDPPGFALESFDVMGGWRDHYRGVDTAKTPVAGRGKNGHAFAFHFGLPVDAAGELPDGRPFADIRGFKRLLREEDELLARNLLRQFVTYGTGEPVRFGDRPLVEQMLARARPARYGVRTLIHEVVQSDLFLRK
jgi:hypothetical protein